jgi:LmbE family N-acetylglucosaminyl deacetylase
MLKAQLPQAAGSGFRILCLGSHCDDIEIGCGGSILRLLSEHTDVAVLWVVLSSTPMRSDEARGSAELFLAQAGSKEIVIKEFKDGFLPYQGAEVKNFFEELKHQFSPDLIFTHYQHDLHQDHRLVCELTWNTWRDHLILEYEIPKYDGDFGSPNCFVELDESFCWDKVRYLVDSFATQRDKHWFSEETFRAVLRLRGMECHSASGYAEAFYSRKSQLSPSIN